MTQDYKNNVLHYLVGDLPQNTGSNEPQYENTTVITDNLYTQLRTYFNSIIYFKAFIPSKDNQNNGLNYSVLACYGTLFNESNPSGAFVVIDDKGDLIQVITEYTNGTKIGIIQCLNVDDNGNFYAVEERNSSYRIVELNNIVLKLSSQARLKATVIKTYSISSSYGFTSINKIYRNADKTRYFILGTTNSGSTVLDYDIAANTWTNWNTSLKWSNPTVYSLYREGWNAYWDANNELQFTLLMEGKDEYDNPTLVKLTKGTGTNMDSHTLVFFGNSTFLHFEAAFYSNKYCYVATSEDLTSSVEININRVDMETLEIQNVYNETTDYTSYNRVWFFKSNAVMYYGATILDSGDLFNMQVGQLSGTRSYNTILGAREITTSTEALFFPNIINQFNKNKMCVQIRDTMYTVEFEWNPNDYNGTAYLSNTSLKPQKGSIEDNSNELLNRNLYNLATYLNRYTATYQVPDNYLNSDTLKTAKLYSKNNNLLTSNTIDTTKNKYEELNINITNSFKIINNDETENIDSASDLVSYMLNSSNTASITKFKINYKDDTSEIKGLSINTSNTDNVTLKLVFYVPKLVDTIELISDDENTVYQTISGDTLEIDKYYSILQRVRVE